ncbi:MAG TPA: hypothetical protein VFV72_02625 [Candidatus Limnocylindrales bacterium]|nr:hypothetical protein [Candidatus Limnocylindrales bacterium]
MDGVIFGAVVAARILVPLAIPHFPLPAMLAALVIDGVDQTIFSTFTSLDLSGYQQYDKALDIYYLSIAYVATLRNWTNLAAFSVSRFLYYYRLVGVVIFELTQIRAVLLVFPNTFEYFFDAYEGIRARWDPRRMSPRLVIGIAAFIWIFIKLPQEWWIHVAQLDMTDFLKETIFGVDPSASWGEAIANNPLPVILTVVVLVVAAVAGWWLLQNRLPPADHPLTFSADAHQPKLDLERVAATRKRTARNLFDRELAEKVVLVSLVSIIFGRMLPGVEASPLVIAAGVAIVIVVNAAISDYLVRQATRLGYHTTTRQFIGTLAVNLGIVAMGQVLLEVLRGQTLQHALIFALLLSLIVTFYDRYRPMHVTRFEKLDADLPPAA